MPSISELKNRPFASNLENAKILSHITRVRIEKFGISPVKAELFTKSFSQGKISSQEYQQEHQKQLSVNKYLTGTLKHLNQTIDILIDQYDPVKLKRMKLNNAPHSDKQREQDDAFSISRKLDEIKNAEKQFKNSQKELNSVKKKYDKVHDWKYLSNLYKQCDEDKRAIEKLEKDNRKLQADQKKAEFKLARKINLRGENLFNDDIQHTELIELDNELKMLRNKQEYIQERLIKEKENDKD